MNPDKDPWVSLSGAVTTSRPALGTLSGRPCGCLSCGLRDASLSAHAPAHPVGGLSCRAGWHPQGTGSRGSGGRIKKQASQPGPTQRVGQLLLLVEDTEPPLACRCSLGLSPCLASGRQRPRETWKHSPSHQPRGPPPGPAFPTGPPRGPRGLQGLAPPQVLCQVSLAQVSDVDKAVAAAKDAFENGLWGKISARDRGRLLYRCEPHSHPHSQGTGMLLGGRTRDCTASGPRGRTLMAHHPPGEARAGLQVLPLMASQPDRSWGLPPWESLEGPSSWKQTGVLGPCWWPGRKDGSAAFKAEGSSGQVVSTCPPNPAPKGEALTWGASHLPGAHSRPSHPSSQGNTIPSHR